MKITFVKQKIKKMHYQISEKPIRIHKVISQAGIASRRAAEKLIIDGVVKKNGEIVKEMGQKMIIGKDHLSVFGKIVNISRHKKILLYALYKPKNCITSLNDPEGRTTIRDFFPRNSERLFPVGRLDYDTEGVILVTNHGNLAQQLMHPSNKVSKGYFVKVQGRTFVFYILHEIIYMALKLLPHNN